MAKYKLRLKARNLRRKGISVKSIAHQLNVSKSTASLWVRDIILTVEQLEKLKQIELKGAERGRFKSALLQKQKKLELIEKSAQEGLSKLDKLTEKEFFVAGLALYWGEGNKKGTRVELCNSDPKMIQFILLWLYKFFEISDNEIVCYIGINEAHREREDIVKEYWSRVTNIPLDQFRQTSWKKVINKKVYENFNEHYGVFVIRVLKPARIYYKLIGYIEGLKKQSDFLAG